MRNTEREIYERELRRQRQVANANANAASGLLMGVFIVAILGIVTAFFIFNQRSQAPVAPAQTPEINIDVPEPQAPEIPNIEAPDVNITVPEPQLPEGSGQSEEGAVDENSAAQPAPAQPQPAPAN